ncbi:MAG TPA: hypothetical protein VI876_11025 [Dehalococcoidia bacterium]|jgi:hypothetical protein|nr:hypothetical protein [Dehalococcoidia bacterium]
MASALLTFVLGLLLVTRITWTMAVPLTLSLASGNLLFSIAQLRLDDASERWMTKSTTDIWHRLIQSRGHDANRKGRGKDA